jgi:hypothetical protein
MALGLLLAVALVVIGVLAARPAPAEHLGSAADVALAAENWPSRPRAQAAPTTVAPTSTTVAVSAPAPARTVRPVKTARARPAAQPAARPEDIGQRALELISYPWRDRLSVTISFAGPRQDMRAETTLIGNQRAEITAFVRPSDTARSVAVSVAHEIGHLIDWTHLTDADRQEWLRQRGRPDVAWWTCDYCTDYRYGSGDFAETFAAWQVGPVDYRSQVAPLPSAAQFSELSRFFR